MPGRRPVFHRAENVVIPASHTPRDPLPPPPRDEWAREVLAAAEALRRDGRHRLLREVTIVLPLDRRAVEAIELACQALAQGELSPAARDLDMFFDRLAREPGVSEAFLYSVRSVVSRITPQTPPT